MVIIGLSYRIGSSAFLSRLKANTKLERPVIYSMFFPHFSLQASSDYPSRLHTIMKIGTRRDQCPAALKFRGIVSPLIYLHV